MSINEILQLVGTYREKGLILFKEGGFRKCYNEHAMYFTHFVKEMKVHTRQYKNVNAYVHSMGFPERVLGNYVAILQQNFCAVVEEDTPEYVRLGGLQWHSKMHYAAWAESHIQRAMMLKQAEEEKLYKQQILMMQPSLQQESQLVHMIANFRMENATPIDAFQFLLKLKKYVENS